MKFADVSYQGPMRRHSYRCGVTGNSYVLVRGRDVPIDNLDDAKEFAEHPNTFEVDWTVHGVIMRESGDSVENAIETVKDFSYRKKQSLAKSLGVKANQAEEELDEELENEIEGLQKQMETQ